MNARESIVLTDLVDSILADDRTRILTEVAHNWDRALDSRDPLTKITYTLEIRPASVKELARDPDAALETQPIKSEIKAPTIDPDDEEWDMT